MIRVPKADEYIEAMSENIGLYAPVWLLKLDSEIPAGEAAVSGFLRGSRRGRRKRRHAIGA